MKTEERWVFVRLPSGMEGRCTGANASPISATLSIRSIILELGDVGWSKLFSSGDVCALTFVCVRTTQLDGVLLPCNIWE